MTDWLTHSLLLRLSKSTGQHNIHAGRHEPEADWSSRKPPHISVACFYAQDLCIAMKLKPGTITIMCMCMKWCLN